MIHDDVSRLYFIFATVGIPEEISLFKKAYTTVLNSLTASRGFDQITILLDFTDLLRELRASPRMMLEPLTNFADTPVRRTFMDWIRERLGTDQPQDQNKKLLEQFIIDFVPVCDEVRELRHSVERTLQQTLIAVERDLQRGA